jgi:molybdopterin synthase catalytic subunit
MRPAWGPAMVRSTISGGYTDQMSAPVPPKRSEGGPVPLQHVTAAVLDPGEVAGAIARNSDGAVATFVGLVRDHNLGRKVLWLDYEAFAPLAVKTFEQIGAEAAEKWPGARIAIHHRTGRVAIGEASVAIAAASPHRADAFAACRYAIERVKQIAPIWKHEHFEGGEVWIEGATADPADEGARLLALERACT